MATAGAVRLRVDAELVRRGLARSRAQAAGFVAAGRVRVDGRPAAKAASVVGPGQELTVQPDAADPGFASRAGAKLAGVLAALAAECAAPRVDGAVCLDLGACTGGFTDVLLRWGARRVLALDVGHGQLRPELRADPRVWARDGRNARDLAPGDLPEPPDLIVADLSFISLIAVLPAIAGVAPPGAALLLLVKPQFEVGRERLGAGGVVRDVGAQRDVLVRVGRAAAEVGLAPLALVPSALPGPAGNREFFWYLRAGGAVAPDGGAPGSGALTDNALVGCVAAGEAALAAAAGKAVAWSECALRSDARHPGDPQASAAMQGSGGIVGPAGMPWPAGTKRRARGAAPCGPAACTADMPGLAGSAGIGLPPVLWVRGGPGTVEPGVVEPRIVEHEGHA